MTSQDVKWKTIWSLVSNSDAGGKKKITPRRDRRGYYGTKEPTGEIHHLSVYLFIGEYSLY
jgi:hypothetical protein